MANVPEISPNGRVIIRGEAIVDAVLIANVDIYTDITHRVESRITQYPVESGAMSGDHVIREPRRIELTGWVSDLTNSVQVPSTTWGQLIKLWEEAELLTVYTPLFTYEDMVITKIDAPIDRGMGRALRFDIELTELVGKEVSSERFPYSFQYKPSKPVESPAEPDELPFDYGPHGSNPYLSKGATLQVPEIAEEDRVDVLTPAASREVLNAAQNVKANGGTDEEAAAAGAALAALHGANRTTQGKIYDAIVKRGKQAEEAGNVGIAPPSSIYVKFLQYNLHQLQKGPDADGKITAQISLPPNDLESTLSYDDAPATSELVVELQYELEWLPYVGEWKMSIRSLSGDEMLSVKINPDSIVYFNSNNHFSSTRTELLKRNPNLPKMKPLADRRANWLGNTKYLMPPGAIYIDSTGAERPFDFQAFSSNEYKVMWSP